jgi:hypothetical protein
VCLSAVCRARDASPPVRVERNRPCEVKAVQAEEGESGGTLVGALAESLDTHGTLSVPAREAALHVLSASNDHRSRYEEA